MSDNEITVLATLLITVPVFIVLLRMRRREAQVLIAEARKLGWSNVRAVGDKVSGDFQGHPVHFGVSMDDGETGRTAAMKLSERNLPLLVITTVPSPLAIDGWWRRVTGKEWPPLMTTNDPIVNANFAIYTSDAAAAQRILNDPPTLKSLKNVIARDGDRLMIDADGIELQSLGHTLTETFEAVNRAHIAVRLT